MTSITMSNPFFPHLLHNPVKILHRYKEAGFTEKQAEVNLEIISECFEQVEATAATKLDLKELEYAFRRDIKELELKLEIKFKEIDTRFREIEMRLTIKMGAVTSAVVGFFFVLEKFFK